MDVHVRALLLQQAHGRALCAPEVDHARTFGQRHLALERGDLVIGTEDLLAVLDGVDLVFFLAVDEDVVLGVVEAAVVTQLDGLDVTARGAAEDLQRAVHGAAQGRQRALRRCAVNRFWQRLLADVAGQCTLGHGQASTESSG